MEGRMEQEGDRRVERYRSRLEERMREELGVEDEGKFEEEGNPMRQEEGEKEERIRPAPAVSDRMRDIEERGEMDMRRED
jgi:hypothetical protein